MRLYKYCRSTYRTGQLFHQEVVGLSEDDVWVKGVYHNVGTAPLEVRFLRLLDHWNRSNNPQAINVLYIYTTAPEDAPIGVTVREGTILNERRPDA